MKIDAPLGTEYALDTVREVASAAEAAGYAGVWSIEAQHDPFLPLLLAAEHTSTLELGTGIAVAFSRTPMTMAYQADDLQRYSQGRFILGLGSQIKPHITRRFAMPWSQPAARMREFITALRAIWTSWETGAPLQFQGEFYSHTLMTPFFSPGPNPHGNPPIFLAAVGQMMTRVAGELADGLLVHGFTTPDYLREHTLPRLAEGLEAAGRERGDIEVSYPCFVATGRTPEQMETAKAAVRQHLSFYGSTPAYKPVLELHGWGEVADQLTRLSKENQPDSWLRMSDLISDDILETFAIVAEPEKVAAEVGQRFGTVVDRLSFYAPYDTEPGLWEGVLADLR